MLLKSKNVLLDYLYNNIWIKALIFFNLCFLMIALYQSLSWPLSIDSPILHYISWLILEGKKPYLEIFDMNFPGTYLIHIFIIKVFSESEVAARYFDIFLLIFLNYLIFLILRKNILSTILAILFFSSFHIIEMANYGMLQRDFIMIPFLFSAYVLISKKKLFAYFISGLLVAYACFIKPIAAIFGIYYLYLIIKKSSRNHRIKNLLPYLLGGLSTSLLILGWLYSLGSLNSFFSILISFSLDIYQHYLNSPKTFIFYQSFSIVIFLLPLIFLKHRTDDKFVELCSLTILSISGVLLQNKGWKYHFYISSYFTILLACYIIPKQIDNFSNKVIVISLLIFTFVNLVNLGKFKSNPLEDVDRQMVEDLKPYKNTSGKVQIMDIASNATRALYLNKIKQATKYIYDFQFYLLPNHPYIKSLREDYIKQLQLKKPEAILITDNFRTPDLGFKKLNIFPEFKEYLLANYHIDKANYRYHIYKRNN